MRQTIILMAACAALLASCTNEEMNEGLGIDTPIQVTASVEGIMTTRAENTKDNLDNFGLYIKDKDGGYDTNYGGENIKVSKLEGESVWTLANEVLYQGSGQTYFAYAPYQSIEAGATSVDFTVEANQSADEGKGMQRSDLLYAAGNVDDPTLAITFNHKLSKLTVTLQKGENLTENVTFNAVTLRGTKLGTTLALEDGDGVKAGDLGQAEGTAADITMCPATTANTYECILVPQAATYSVLIYATVGGEQKTYVYTPSAPQEFLENKSYTLTLTVKNADVSMGNIGVNDWDGDDIPLTAGEAIEPYTIEADGSYTVRTAEGLLKWAAAVISGNDINCTLAADIDMTKESWTPIRTGLASQYNGVFDGNGHTIIGLGNCLLEENDGEVRNLTLVNPTGLTLLGSIFSAGAVAGINEGTIENCHVVGGSVKGDACSGGIVGINGGTIRACSSSATVTTDGYNDSRGGGIVGGNSGTILACYTTGSVNAGDGMEGAIAGWHVNDYGGTITACYWSGDAEKGVGVDLGTNNTTKVEGDVSWADAAEAMNEALETDGSTYLWTTNMGGETGNRPLVIVTR